MKALDFTAIENISTKKKNNKVAGKYHEAVGCGGAGDVKQYRMKIKER